MFYKKALKPLLFKFDPEKVHNLFVSAGALLGRSGALRYATRSFYGYRGKDISKEVSGLQFKIPLILSAGFDYNGKLLGILPEVSFGGVEVGSVTARPCEGNEKPRMRRLPKSGSILVNKGLRNDGVDAVIKRLKKYKKKEGFVVGISIARTNDKQSSSVEEGLADYLYSFRRLNEENIGDYYAINISCPNAFTGETFANPGLLQRLLTELSSVSCDKPVFVKMPINLKWEEFDLLLKILEKFQFVKGLIIGNLNKDYNSLDFRDEAPAEYRGGLSGKPCSKLSNELIKKTREVYGKRFAIIGCGGVMSAQDMKEKYDAGADIVALVTGMIYNGPGFMKELANHYSTEI